MKRSLLILTCVVGALGLLASCSTPANITYFQDTEQADGAEIAAPKNIILKPGDMISIIVNAKTPELSALFNLPYTTHRIGQNSNAAISGTSNSQISGYTIGDDGMIDFPTLGRVKIAGMDKQQVAKTIKDNLREEGQVNDAVVTVEFMNLYYQVLGEVARPGRFPINKDAMTLLDAIASAGDLTIQGTRGNVKVLRDEDGHQKTYEVDFTSARSLIYSPAYYLKQNDVIYVEPNDIRKRQSTVNGNNLRSASFWMSLGSFVTSTILVIQRISRYM